MTKKTEKKSLDISVSTDDPITSELLVKKIKKLDRYMSKIEAKKALFQKQLKREIIKIEKKEGLIKTGLSLLNVFDKDKKVYKA
jgi:hypothetical protein